jgi:hypothetical protein
MGLKLFFIDEHAILRIEIRAIHSGIMQAGSKSFRRSMQCTKLLVASTCVT